MLKLVRIYKYFPTAKEWVRDDQQRKDRVQTIASLRNQDPLFLEHAFGNGRVITCLTSAQPDWNNWAKDNSFVVVQLELVKYLARTDHNPERRLTGEPIEISLDPAEFADSVADPGSRLGR